MSAHKARQESNKQGGQSGQGLVEMALVVPILFIVFMGLLEVALAFNAVIGVNRASQNGAHLAAIMGNQTGADCLILTAIEADVYVPNDRSRIIEVVIDRSNKTGTAPIDPVPQTWTRTPSTPTACPLPDGTIADVPYTLDPGSLFPPAQRCTVLLGCPLLTPPRSTVDNIGVGIKYRHEWATPLNAAFNVFAGGSTGWTITQRNVFRVEPVL